MRESSGELKVRPVSIGWKLRASEAFLRQLQEGCIITVMRLGTHQGVRPRLTYGRSSESIGAFKTSVRSDVPGRRGGR
jgi:hypothetical protein